MRAWLNEAFLKAAFDSDEVGRIAETTVAADQNPKYSTYAGNSTQDRVFLLSISEAEQYFSSIKDRECYATGFAKSQSAYTGKSGGTCLWWLRTPGKSDYSTTYVLTIGAIGYEGNAYGVGQICVRPAMWVNLN